MQLEPPTIEDVFADYGIEIDQLDLQDEEGYHNCPQDGCYSAFVSQRELSRHNAKRHRKSIMEAIVEEQSDDDAWEDALREALGERGYSVSAIARKLPSHTGDKRIKEDAEKYDIDYTARVTGGVSSKLQHFKPEELGLSPLGEVD